MDDLDDSCDFFAVEPESNPESLQQWLSIVETGKTTAKKNGTRRSEISATAKKHLSSLGWRFAYFPRKNNKREVRYKSPMGKWFYSLATACSSCVYEENDCETTAFDVSKALVNVGETTAFNRNKALLCVDVRRTRMRVHECETTAFSVKNRFSGVNKVILKVDVSKKRKRVNDCETASFNPLSDVIDQQQKKRMAIRPRYEKSLRKVLQVMERKNKKCEKESVKFWRKGYGPEKNCDVCCVCHFGGDLLLCDGCPAAFHHTCIGLSNLPEEELWFCPCCCCDACGSMVTLGNSKLMSCEQCQRRFHLKCLKEESSCLVSVRGWFCSKQCSRVFSAVESLLGRKIVVGEEEGLVWSLIRAPNDDEHYDDEQMSKLDSAVEVLHQGFEPSTDPFSGRDLVEELILRKDADGVGLGFYTVLVERNDVPVTVAAMRVDKDVAEIPLVATLSSYRRSGMCRVLMDELEKQMSRMGVRRLVLPAAKDVVSTWSQGFGFKVMESWERLEFVKHGMLDFVGTVMCHKFLRGREESGESSLTE